MASLALLIVQGALPLLSLYLIKLVVDAVATGLAAPDKGVAFGRVALLIGLTGVVTLVSALCHSIAGLVSEAQGQVVIDHMHDILHAKSIEAYLEYYENSRYARVSETQAQYYKWTFLTGLRHSNGSTNRRQVVTLLPWRGN